MIVDWTKFLEFLYDNGFIYIAQNNASETSARAYENKPEFVLDGMYWENKEGAIFYIDLAIPGGGTFPVIPGECMKVEDLLRKDKMDAVNHPKHYQLPSGRESVDVMREILTEEEFRGWCKGNALKYIFREGKKDDAVQDIKKAGKFLEFLTGEE